MADTGPPTAEELWGDEKFADATVIMGSKTWRVHRWVVCQQSEFFMRGFEGEFKEAKTKTIDLSDRDLAQEDVEMLLKFLYTHDLDRRQKADPLTAAIVADHFQARTLRTKALEELRAGLRNLIISQSFVNFKRWALRILDKHTGTEIEQALVEGTAANITALVHNRVIPSTWDDIVVKHPGFANKVLLALLPKPEILGVVGIKRSVGTAFDDAYAI